jgi:autotransporter-associated beta strand protein
MIPLAVDSETTVRNRHISDNLETQFLMKSHRFSRLFSATWIIGISSPAWAVDIFKADNTNDLAAPESWTTVAPTSADRAVWNNTVLSANTSNLGTTATWLGIKIGDGSGNPGGNVGIAINTGRTLTLGSNGIDLTQASVDLTISGNGNLRTASSTSQTFAVPVGRTLTIDTTMSAAGGTTTVTMNGAGNTNFNNAVSTSLILNNTGTGTVTMGGSAASSLFQLGASGTGSKVVVNGPTITTSQLGTYGNNGGGGSFDLQSGTMNFNAGVRTAGGDGTLIKVSGGTFSTTDLQLQRTSNPGQTANVTGTSGFVVTGGTASVGTLRIGTGVSSATSRIDGGAVTITDNVNIGNNTANSRWNTLQVNSGSLTVSGTTGIQLSTNTASINNSQLLLTGGTTTTEAIRYGVAASAAGSRGDVIVNNGATLYIGSGGVNVISGNSYTSNFTLNNATLGAQANWSTSVPMTMTGVATVKAADAANAAFNIDLNGALTGTGGLTKTGAGTLTLGGANSFEGVTTISEGSLALGAAASITSPGIINNGNFNVSAVVGYSLGSGQSISGSGTVTGDMVVAGTLSPGNSPGTLSTGNLVWATGGDYNWQVLDAAGAAGGGYDTINITGTLDLSGLASSGFNINLWSLSSVGPDVSGDASNFNNASAYSWTIATTTAGITGFDAADFSISTVANNGTAGFSNGLAGGAFTLAQSGNNLVLNFAPVPEPGSALLGGLGLLALMRRRRK